MTLKSYATVRRYLFKSCLSSKFPVFILRTWMKDKSQINNPLKLLHDVVHRMKNDSGFMKKFIYKTIG